MTTRAPVFLACGLLLISAIRTCSTTSPDFAPQKQQPALKGESAPKELNPHTLVNCSVLDPSKDGQTGLTHFEIEWATLHARITKV